MKRFLKVALSIAALCLAAACSSSGGGTTTYAIGGTLTGLGTGLSVILQNTTAAGATPESITVSANGAYEFTTKLATGATYAVTVGTNPTGQTCTVENATGTVASAAVTNVNVSCGLSGASNLVYSPAIDSDQTITMTDDGVDGISGTTAPGGVLFDITYAANYASCTANVTPSGGSAAACTGCAFSASLASVTLTGCTLTAGGTPTEVVISRLPLGDGTISGDYHVVGEPTNTVTMAEDTTVGQSTGTLTTNETTMLVVYSENYGSCNSFLTTSGTTDVCTSCAIDTTTGKISITCPISGVPTDIVLSKTPDPLLDGNYGLVYDELPSADVDMLLDVTDTGTSPATAMLTGAGELDINYAADYASCTATVGGADCSACAINATTGDVGLTCTVGVSTDLYMSKLPTGTNVLNGNYRLVEAGVNFDLVENHDEAVATGIASIMPGPVTYQTHLYYSTDYAHCNMILEAYNTDPHTMTACTDCLIGNTTTGTPITATCGAFGSVTFNRN